VLADTFYPGANKLTACLSRGKDGLRLDKLNHRDQILSKFQIVLIDGFEILNGFEAEWPNQLDPFWIYNWSYPDIEEYLERMRFAVTIQESVSD
jgi:hypothetical protein